MQHGSYSLHILAVLYAEHPFDTALVLLAVIGDSIAAEASVGHINHTVVEGGQYGVENLYFLYRAAYSRSVYVVAYLEWLENQYNQSAGKVGKVSGKRHTYSHTCGCKQRRKAGGFHTELADDGKGKNHIQQNLYQTLQKGLHAGFNLPLFEYSGYQHAYLPDDETSDYID